MQDRRDRSVPVIDLGLVRDVPEVERQRPVGGRPPFWSRSARRSWASAGCLALVLLALAGAAPQRPSLFLAAHQPPAGATGYAVAGDRLYVLTGDSESTLSAYHLPDGRRLWSAPAEPAEYLVAWRTGGVVLVMSRPARGGCCDVVAYDGTDGERHWSKRAGVVGFDAREDVVALAGEDSTRVVDIPSGRVRWAGGGSAVWHVTWAGSLVLTYPDGTAERRDLSTGEVLATGRVHPRGDDLLAEAIVDGQLVVGHSGDYQTATVDAYDVDTLAPAWRRAHYPIDGLDGCGPMLCLRGGRGLEAVDPRTGAVRWHRAGWYGVEQGGRLLAFGLGLGALRAIGAVDPSTGRILLDLRPWEFHLGNGEDSRLVLTRAAATGRTAVALADLSALTVDVLGVIPGRVTDCQAGTASLACRTAPGGELQLWAYRR